MASAASDAGTNLLDEPIVQASAADTKPPADLLAEVMTAGFLDVFSETGDLRADRVEGQSNANWAAAR